MALKNSPFWFGGAAQNQYFTDREDDTKRLVSNFTYGLNTILISPRRWGKTSLVLKSAQIAKAAEPALKIVTVDIFSCRTVEEFCHRFATALIQQTSTKVEEWIETGKRLLSRLRPVFSFGADPFNDFSVKFTFDQTADDMDEVLDLAEKIARDKGIHIVVCIDEFQQIGEFDGDMSFQKRMRGVWQLQQNVNYCLFGSKKHLMESLFSHPDVPFYKFGDIINLQRIPTDLWVRYILERFESTGKSISSEIAAEICRIVDNNSSYVQQLSWYVWSVTDHTVTDANLRQGFNLLMSQNIALFEKQTENLSPAQYNYLLAMADGVKGEFYSQVIIQKYGLKNSPTVRAAQKALEKKELIFKESGKIYFTDPLLPYWLKQRSRPSLHPYELFFSV